MQQPDDKVTVALAEQLQREAERAYAAADLEAILASFDPDITIIYADFPAIHGLSEARKFIGKRLARQKNYQLMKELRAITGNIIAGAWSGSWTDADPPCTGGGQNSGQRRTAASPSGRRRSMCGRTASKGKTPIV